MTRAKREDLKVRDITDAKMTATGLVKENFLVGFELTISLWEENLKVLNSQLDKWFNFHKGYVTLMKDVSEKFPNEGMKIWGEAFKPLSPPTDWFTSLRQGHAKSWPKEYRKDIFSL